jgi:hypothetical protein
MSGLMAAPELLGIYEEVFQKIGFFETRENPVPFRNLVTCN